MPSERVSNVQNAIDSLKTDIPGLTAGEYKDLYQFIEGGAHNFNMLNNRLSSSAKQMIAAYLYREGIIGNDSWSSVDKNLLKDTLQGELRSRSGVTNLVDAKRLNFTDSDVSDEDINNGSTNQDIDEQEAALNAFYQDAYSLEDGTTGKSIYDSLLQAEQDAALSNMELAEANYQRQAMQQAQTVKNITDQVRAERVARLRAGMSEAQIANQDMQTLMSNVNALNQQMADADIARLQAQQQYQNAQNTAYQAWLANANSMAQTGAAYAASNAGDIVQQALRYSAITGTPYKKSVEILNGSAQNQNKN